jgi:hypothetical protein
MEVPVQALVAVVVVLARPRPEAQEAEQLAVTVVQPTAGTAGTGRPAMLRAAQARSVVVVVVVDGVIMHG